MNIQTEFGKIERSMRSFIAAYKPRKAVVVIFKGKKGKVMVNGCNIIYTDIFNLEKQL